MFLSESQQLLVASISDLYVHGEPRSMVSVANQELTLFSKVCLPSVIVMLILIRSLAAILFLYNINYILYTSILYNLNTM